MTYAGVQKVELTTASSTFLQQLQLSGLKRDALFKPNYSFLTELK